MYAIDGDVDLYPFEALFIDLVRNPHKVYQKGPNGPTQKEVAARNAYRSALVKMLEELLMWQRAKKYPGLFWYEAIYMDVTKIRDMQLAWDEATTDEGRRALLDEWIKDERLEQLVVEEHRKKVLAGEESATADDIEWLRERAQKAHEDAQILMASAASAKKAAEELQELEQSLKGGNSE